MGFETRSAQVCHACYLPERITGGVLARPLSIALRWSLSLCKWQPVVYRFKFVPFRSKLCKSCAPFGFAGQDRAFGPLLSAWPDARRTRRLSHCPDQGMWALPLYVIGLGASFAIRQRWIACAVRRRSDSPGGNRLAHRRFRDVALCGIASPGHSHSDRNIHNCSDLGVFLFWSQRLSAAIATQQ